MKKSNLCQLKNCPKRNAARAVLAVRVQDKHLSARVRSRAAETVEEVFRW